MITTVTLNASIDKAYHMDQQVVGGTVMRVHAVKNSAGGKGLNVARAAKICGSRVQATGLVGGFNGRYLEQLTEQDGIVSAFGHIAGETRSCINILDERFSSTEFLEPGCEVSAQELEEYLEEFPRIIAQSAVVTISGSLSVGVPIHTYKLLVEMCKQADKPIILDTSGEALLQGISAHPTMIKPNQDELEALFGVSAQSRADVLTCAQRLYEGGIAQVVISLGGQGALLVCEQGTFQAIPPALTVVNTVGCGDSMVAAFAVGFERGMSAPDALVYAVAVASAAALSTRTGHYDPAHRDEILPQIELRKLA